jgi:hypothetical protein
MHECLGCGGLCAVGSEGFAAARNVQRPGWPPAPAGVVAAADMVPTESGYEISQLFTDRPVLDIADALTAVEQGVSDGGMAVRRLDIPAVHLIALWLQPSDRAVDGEALLVTVVPAAQHAPQFAPRPANAVLSELTQQARQAVAATAHDSLIGGC